MEPRCRRCKTPIPAEDIRLDLAIAKCGQCSSIYDLTSRATREALGMGGGNEPEPELEKPRPAPPIPRRFRVEEQPGGLWISWRWFHPLKHLPLLVFCLFWDGFLLFWYTMAILGGSWAMTLFPLLHVAVGVGLTYSVVAGLFNTTRVEVAHGLLSIRHGPLPWPGNRDILSSDLEQLYCQEKVHRGKNGVSLTYNLMAILRNGREQKLLSGLNEVGQALYLEQRLERQLRIQDRPVPGELDRKVA